jgi:transcriptional regulator with XRE-family HTH domain
MTRLGADTQAHTLGSFLRSLRERQIPSAHGIARQPRRRTPGLRREEVAQICGLSSTWYTWIEQGRDVSVSSGTLARLARGLRLSRGERAYLFELAGKRDPDKQPDSAEDIPAAVLACVDAIAGPAYILDRMWTAQRWNTGAAHLFAGWLGMDGDRNLLRYIFLHPEARRLICDWEERSHRVTAEFRAATTGHGDDPYLRNLISDLSRQSTDFARCWEMHGVAAREGGLRTFYHPTDGFVRYQQVSLTIAGWPDFRLTMLLGPAMA